MKEKIEIFIFCYLLHSVRGTMNSMCFIANSLGNLIAFAFALFMDYQNQAICALFIPILYIFAFSFVPETPVFLRKKNLNEVSINTQSVTFKKSYSILTLFSQLKGHWNFTRELSKLIQRNSSMRNQRNPMQ